MPTELENSSKEKIPKTCKMVVTTKNATYHFSPEDKNGARGVFRDDIALAFFRCKIKTLEDGLPMVLDTLSILGDHPTTDVVSVTCKK